MPWRRRRSNQPNDSQGQNTPPEQSTPPADGAGENRQPNQQNNRPGDRPGNRPGNRSGNRAGNRQGNRSGSRPENRPQNRSDNRPENRPENQAQGAAESAPENRPETQGQNQNRPSNRQGNRPRGRFGSRQNGRPGSRPVDGQQRTDNRSDNRPENRQERPNPNRPIDPFEPPPMEIPVKPPEVPPESRRSNRPDNRQSNQQGSRPGQRQGRRPGDRPQNRTGDRSGDRPGDRQQNRSQTNQQNLPPTEVIPGPRPDNRRGRNPNNRSQGQPTNQDNRQPGRQGQNRPQNRPQNRLENRKDNRRGNIETWSNLSTPIRTNRGIKARSQRGAFSKNWWAKRWIESMEMLVDPLRLQRGRNYARTGQVLSLIETERGVEAQVQGSRPQPYHVTIHVKPLTDQQWDLVVDALSEQALFTAELLAGEMPSNIEDAFHTAGVSLFPEQTDDLSTDCTCPDWANPCKHVAATHYILGDHFDDDPFLLFRMRGRSQEQILQAIRERRSGGSEPETEEEQPEAALEQSAPLEDEISHFWDPTESLDTFPLTIQPPSIEMPLLQRLGEPAFLTGEPLQSLLRPAYQNITRSALLAAYSEEEPIESNGNGNGIEHSEENDGEG